MLLVPHLTFASNVLMACFQMVTLKNLSGAAVIVIGVPVAAAVVVVVVAVLPRHSSLGGAARV